MKKLLFGAAALCFASTVSFAQKKPAAKPVAAKAPVNVLKNENDSMGYAIGMNIGNSLKQQGLEKINTEMLKRAINEVLAGKPTIMDHQTAGMTLQQKLQAAAGKKVQVEKDKGAAYMANNKKRQGVLELPNGLQYEILEIGMPDGAKPKAQDTVVVHYVGTLLNGTEFDNSVKRGEPATFPLQNVIRGWTEILQHMPKGAKWKVWIPSDLAYGDRGAGANIPPGATLQFVIDLLDIKPAVTQ